MSWLFSQALVEAFSEENSWGGEPCAQLNVMPTLHKFWRNDKTMEFSNLSRFGLTLNLLTESHGEELLTWFRAGFPVRTYPAQGRGRELKELDQDCGLKWQELSAKYDLCTHSWKTAHCLFPEDLHWSSVTLPKWGMTASGALFQHPTAERPISEIGAGCWLPTPTASEGGRNKSASSGAKIRPSLGMMAKKGLWLTPRASDTGRGEGNQTFIKRMGDRTENCAQSLAAQVNNPTTWPTLQASDNRDRGNLGSPAIRRRKEKGRQIMLSQSVSEINGALNPEWVEWLMAFPIGWTGLKPLAMPRYQAWLQQHSEFYQQD